MSTAEEEMNALIDQVDGFKSLGLFANVVFEVPKSLLTLTPPETEARREWNERRRIFIDENEPFLLDGGVPLKVASLDDFLSSAIIPPRFSETFVSSRSKYDEKRKKRLYPRELKEWTAFTSIYFSPTTTTLPVRVFNPLRKSGQWEIIVANEKEEEIFLREFVWLPCVQAGLMCDRIHEAKLVGEDPSLISAVVGLPDYVEYAGGMTKTAGRKTAMIECKSSHNLLLPNQFQQISTLYNVRVTHQVETRSRARSKDWSQICHPLGQLFAYMVDNGVRFGALCSASKTFFVFFDGKGDDIGTVRITEACLTAGRNFLRSWASFVMEARKSEHVSEQRTAFSLPTTDVWLAEPPLKSDVPEGTAEGVVVSGSGVGPNREHRDGSDRLDESGTGGGLGEGPVRKRPASSLKTPGDRPPNKHPFKQRPRGANEPEVVASEPEGVPLLEDSPPQNTVPAHVIPRTFRFNVLRYDFEDDFVNFYDPDDFKIGQVLGRGRNGDVFLGDFGGESVAVKQFDLSKNFDSYQREVEGYKFLKDAWGELVPEPKFIGASRSGMVRFLGLQKGTLPTGNIDDEFYDKLEQLRTGYHFRHLDSSHGRNAIYVQEKGTKKLLIVDLESWEDTRATGSTE
jgi:hypothetical protein